ncbi:ABC transporter permease [filamentous cyanobacterium LEGE 11480]|uniref:ABC transporter permease n=1 Tax=Romeriopsis navalis LEGE 11480 TaxID=2777977 RepID=A0A928VRR8_9CYAN|nr:ABC transporter permease [Romeriopsis navalis]MBE9033441.1 ABC transporter permease [Romeriopsis navalis LEGE 11480]
MPKLPTLELFFAEFRRSWIQFRRYPAEAIGGIFIITSVFYGLFLSAQYVAGPGLSLGDRLDSIIVGYILWTMVTFILFDISGTLQREAQTGTLEQLFLAAFSTPRLFFIRAVASLMIQMILIVTILGLIMLLTSRFLAFPIVLFLPLLSMIFGAYGLAFIIGSLTLLFKRIQQLFAVVQFSLLFLISTPTEEWEGTGKLISYFLPMTPGAGLLRDLMARQIDLSWDRLAIAFLNGGVYFTIGILIFRWAERRTKQQGKLSGY